MRIILKISTMPGSIDQIKNTLFNEYQVRRGAMASGGNNDEFRASFQISPLEIPTETFLRHADVFSSLLNGLHDYGRLRVWIFNSTSCVVFPL